MELHDHEPITIAHAPILPDRTPVRRAFRATTSYGSGVEISLTGPSFTLNNERRLHPHQRADLVAAWRDPVKLLVRQPQHRWRADGPVGLEVYSACRAKADRGAYFPAAKAIIDGLSDKPNEGHRGWWPDDSGEWVAWERHWVPEVDRSLPVGLVKVTVVVVVTAWDAKPAPSVVAPGAGARRTTGGVA